ncbi:unnamed protein product, partial [Allacma fusca]
MPRILDNSSYRSIIITGKMRLYLKQALNIGMIWGGHPMRWNIQLKRSELGSQRQMRLWRVNMVLAFCHLSFVYVRWIQIELGMIPASRYLKVYIKGIVGVYSIAGVLHYGVIQKRMEMNSLVNMCLRTIQNFERRYVKASSKPSKTTKLVEFVMQLVCHTFRILRFVMTIFSLVAHRSPEQFSSIFGDVDSRGTIIVAAIINTIFMNHIIYIFYSSGTLLVQTGLICISSLAVSTELNPKSSSVTKDKLRSGKSLILTLKWFTLILNFGIDIYCSKILPLVKVLFMVSLVMGTYVTIKIPGIAFLVLIFLMFFGYGFLIILFTLLAEFNTRGCELKWYWKGSRGTDPWFQKSLKALPVTPIKLGGAYFVDREM